MWLKAVFDCAREHLTQAADCRRQVHYQLVKDLPLNKGQVVFLHDFSAWGSHKIRDWWSLVKYRVLRALQEDSSVYIIAPVDDQTKIRRVHSTMLKVVVEADSAGCVSSCSLAPVADPLFENYCSLDYDFSDPDSFECDLLTVPCVRVGDLGGKFSMRAGSRCWRSTGSCKPQDSPGQLPTSW